MGPTSLFGVKYNEVYLGVWSIIQWGLLGCLEYSTMGPTWVFGVRYNGAYLGVFSKVHIYLPILFVKVLQMSHIYPCRKETCLESQRSLVLTPLWP